MNKTFFKQGIHVTGDSTLTGDQLIEGNTTIGNAITDNLVVNARVGSEFTPNTSVTYNLGSSSLEWHELYVQDVFVSSLTTSGVMYAGANGQALSDSNFMWDPTTATLTVNGLAVGGTGSSGGATFDNITIAGDTLSSSTGQIVLDADVVVEGSTFSVDVTNTSLTDPIITLAGDSPDDDLVSADAFDRGISYLYYDTGATTSAATAMVDGTAYVISTAGTTDFTIYGAENNLAGTTFTANEGCRVTGTESNPTLTATDAFVINGTTVTLTGTDLETLVTDITTAAITGITASVESDNLVLRSDGVDLTIATSAGTVLTDLGISAGTTSKAFVGTGTVSLSGSTTLSGYFGWDRSANRFTYIPNATITSNAVSGSTGDAQFNSLYLDTDLEVTNNSSLLGTLDVTGVANFNDTTTSTDSTTGAVVVDGGVGVAENLNVGGNADVTGSLTVDGTVTLGDAITDATQVNGTLHVDGATVLATASVEDLTATRIVTAGTSGELEDSADLTFDGATLNVGAGNATVTTSGVATFAGAITGATATVQNLSAGRVVFAGSTSDLTDHTGLTYNSTTSTLNATNAVLGSAAVSDLTENRIVIAGASGELEDDANFTFDGTTFNVTGAATVDNVRIDGNTISATDTDGDLRLSANGTGQIFLDSPVALESLGDLVLTDSSDFTMQDSTSPTPVDVFTVDGATGNVVSLGTLDVSGATSLLNTTNSTSSTTGALTVAGGAGIAQDLYVGGNVDVEGNIVLRGTITIGDSTTDNIIFNGEISTDITPDINGAYDLGTSVKAWQNLFLSDSLTFNGLSTENNIEIPTNQADALSIASGLVDFITFDSTSGTPVVNVAQAATFASSVDIDGQATTASLNVEDLTAGRVVLAGTSGELEDSSNLTFSSNLLTVTGDTTVTGTLDVNTAATLATAKVEDLTANRVVLAGTAGELEDSADFTFDGTTFEVGTAFDVIVANGNTTIGGTLDAGATTLSSAKVSDLTTNRIVVAGTDGELIDDSAFTFDGTTFEVGTAFDVIASSGNTTVGGTLDVTGATNFNNTTTSTSATTGAVIVDGGVGIAENLNVGGNTVLGDADTDTITFTAKASSSLLVDTDNAYDLGDSTNQLRAVYARNMIVDASTFGNVQIAVTDDNTIDTVTGNLTINSAGGTVTIDDNVGITGDVNLDSTTTSTSTTTGALIVDGGTGIAENLNVGGESTLASATVSDLTSGRVVLAGTAGAIEDSANLTFDGSTLAVTGAQTISTTLGVTGESTLASAIVSDLTAGRVVLAGTAGAIEDSANLTFDGSILIVDTTDAVQLPVGTTLERPTAATGQVRFNTTDTTFEGYDGTAWGSLGGVKDVDGDTYILAESSAGTDNDELDFFTAGSQRMEISSTGNFALGNTLAEFTIAGATGNTVIAGTINTGEATVSSAIVSDLTDNRIVIAGTSGALEDDANFTFDGTNFKVGTTTTDKFVVAQATGNTAIEGTLDVTGDTTVAVFEAGESTLASATVSDLTAGRVVLAGTSGAIEDSANLTFDGSTLTATNVTATATVTGTDVTATATVSGTDVTASATVSGATLTDGTASFASGALTGATTGSFSSNVGVGGDLTVNGNTVLGNANTDTITFTAKATSSLLVDADDAYDIGDSTNMLANVYARNIVSDSTTFGNIQIAVTDDNTIDTASGNLTINSATGSTTIGGTLDVTGVTNFNDTTTSTSATTGAVVVDGGVGIVENLNVGGNTVLGNANTDTVTFTAKAASSLLVDTNNSYDIADATNKIRNVYIDSGLVHTDFTHTAEQASLTTVTETVVASFASASFGAAKFIVTVSDGTDRTVTELLVTHDGTTAVATEYAILNTSSALATFDVDIDSGNVRLKATGSTASNLDYNVVETLIV